MAQTVTPLPSIGEVIAGQDVAGRELRISSHPESDRVVLSIWQSGRCLATVRLARTDVPDATRALVAGLVPVPAELPGPSATVYNVHALRPTPPSRLRETSTRLAGRLRDLGTRTRRISRD
jgi:hypothetical protein